MKHLLFISILLTTAFTQCSSQPPKSPRVTAEATDVKVAYGQPSKNGRVIFGELVPYGKVWRTGANEATELTLRKDARVGGEPVKAGTYSLFTIPDKDNWTIILNPELKQWGAYGYEKIKDKDVLRVKVPVESISPAVEKLTLEFDRNQHLLISWDQTRVRVPIEF